MKTTDIFRLTLLQGMGAAVLKSRRRHDIYGTAIAPSKILFSLMFHVIFLFIYVVVIYSFFLTCA